MVGLVLLVCLEFVAIGVLLDCLLALDLAFVFLFLRGSAFSSLVFVVVSGEVSSGASQLSCVLLSGCPSSEMSMMVLVTAMEAVAVEWLSMLDFWLL